MWRGLLRIIFEQCQKTPADDNPFFFNGGVVLSPAALIRSNFRAIGVLDGSLLRAVQKRFGIADLPVRAWTMLVFGFTLVAFGSRFK